MTQTPKEKAEELVGKYMSLLEYELPATWHVYLIKKCALIAVDEMLNEYPSQCPKDSYEMERHIFWNQVKQGLEKL
jgi:hypothetical protein